MRTCLNLKLEKVSRHHVNKQKLSGGVYKKMRVVCATEIDALNEAPATTTVLYMAIG